MTGLMQELRVGRRSNVQMRDSVHGSYGNIQVQGIARNFPTVGSAEKSPAGFKGTCEAESRG